MLDIQFIRDNADLVQKVSKDKNTNVDIKKLLKLDQERVELLSKVDNLRADRNKLADGAKGKKPAAAEITKGKALKDELTKLEADLAKIETGYKDLLWQVPNIMADDTPTGGEESNKVEKDTPKPKLEFEPKDHIALAETNGWLDFERGTKVAGNKFYYLKGAAAKLELALMHWGMDLLEASDFVPMLTPHMVRGEIAEGTGFSPRGVEDQEYKIEGEDLTLIATAEVSLTGYHADEILETKELPLQYAGLAPSYRKEAGAYGKHSKGLFRVHQFDKLEMYVLCKPEDSESWHQKLLALEEQICQELEIPYRVVRIAAGDLGAPAYKKYDIEYWSPAEKTYRELTSCSNCTDYQARNLAIRYRDKDGKVSFVHTLNGTALAFSRVFIALLENHQRADGGVALPKSLHKYYGHESL